MQGRIKNIIFVLSIAVLLLQCDAGKKCNEGLGECVPISYCSFNKTVFSDGTGVIHSRFDLEDEEIVDACHYMEICCDPENIISEEVSRSILVEQINHEAVETCEQQCKLPDSPKPPPKFPQTIQGQALTAEIFPTSPYCGFRNKKGVGLELTSKTNVAQFGEFPWMVALTDSKQYICGGSLIHPEVVLTGAHCVHSRDREHLMARVGEWDTQTTSEPFSHADHSVKMIITHPEYNRQNLFNNVALLVLDHKVEISAHVNTICLPPKNHKFKDERCFASGWGAEDYAKQGVYRANLKKLELPFVHLKTCQDQLRKTKLGPFFKIDTSFMCAGGEAHVDTCIGDGGSPLVCPIPGEINYYYQAGLVSWGVECGLKNVPGVYTNVAKFRDWIDHQMDDLHFEHTYDF